MRSFRLVPALNSFANTTAVFLLTALAAAALLPVEADAQGWLSPQTGYRITTSHVTEGNDFSVTIKLEDAKGRSLPENTRVYTTNGSKNGFPQATAGTDYTAYDQTHSFNLNTSVSFTISTTEDETIEGDEIFVLVVQPGGSGNDKAQVYPRINNDDVGTITISDQSADEGGNVTFTAKHTGKAAAYGFKATPTYTNGTAESGDYTANTTQLSFSGALNEEKTFTVSTTEDAVLETNETVTVGFNISGQDKVKYGTAGVSGGSATLTINNDEDAAAVTVNDASASEGDDITFTISLNNAVEGGLTVTPGSYSNGTAASGDYTENTTGISFTGTKGETKTFTVSTTEDAVLEANETFTVGLSTSNAPSGVTSSDTGTGTINNDDSATVTINDASASEGESMTFTVTLSEAVQGGLTVTPGSYSNGTAASSDYTENTTGITFSGTKGETKTFTVSTTEDAVLEGNETFTVGLSVSGAPSGVTATDTGTGTVNNDDSAEVTIADAEADEGDDITFTITLDEAVQGGLAVTPDFTDVTAVEGTDYDENTTAITFSGTKGETQTFTVSTTEDEVLEANETLTVGLTVSNAPSGVTSTDTGSGTINNDDSAEVTIADAKADEGDDITFTITLDEAVQGGLTVTPDFTDGTAVEGTDYDENTTAITFTGTKGETQTFTVSTDEDAVLESDETFTVGLTASDAPAGTSVTDTDEATGTIDNDDSAEVTIADAEADEGDDITFTITLDEAVQGGLTVTPDFTDVTAVEGTDYDENTTAITFTGTKGETQTFTVSTDEDAVLESDETFTVGLTASDAPAGTSVTDTDEATGTIDNDDSAEVTIADADADEGESMTFTVTLDEAVQGGLTVTPDFTDVTAVEGTDYDENTAAITFTGTKGETQTFTVSTTEDAVLEADETFTVGLTASGAPTGTSVTDTDEATGTVNNDDGATVTINDASASEGDGITFTVTLGAAVQGGLTVTPDFTDVTAVEGTDYDENTAALTFTGTANETQTFTVSTTEDAVLEANETFTVGLTASDEPAGTSVTDTDTGTGTVNNDDSAEVTINDADADEGESMTFTVTLSEAVQGGLTVTPDFTDVTAVEGTDYDENTAALTFTGTKGETKSFTVSTDEDAVLESDETFTVGLSVSNQPSGTTVTATDEGTGTIDNDDSAEVTVNDAHADEGNGITFTVTLSEAVQDGLTVTPGYTNGTAENGDYTANTAGVSFSGSKGETRTFTVSTTEDAVLESDETFTVGLSVSNQPSGTTVTSSDTGTGTIDNDDSSEVTVNDASASEGDGITFTVTLSEAVEGGVTVKPGSYRNGTAESGDYTANTAGISFSGSKGETRTFTVSTTEDAVLESDETFTVGLAASDEPAGTSVKDTDTGTGTINNDDSSEVTVNDASASEGNGITFTVTLSEAVEGGLTVTPDFTDGTAVEGTDYTANTAALSFSGTRGETKSFTVSTTEDAVVEWGETFTVGLTASNAPAGTSVKDTDTGTGTIDNDDSATVSINDASTSESGTMTFTVTLSAAVQGGVTVTPGYTNGTAESGDYTANTAALSFSGAANETHSFSVATTGDAVLEHDETFAVSLQISNAPPGVSAAGAGGNARANNIAFSSLSAGGGTGTILNDDSADLSVSSVSSFEGGVMSFTVTLSAAVQGGLTATPVYTNVTAASGDYNGGGALSFTGVAGERQSLAVSAVDDEVVEGDETFTVGLTVSDAPAGVSAGAGTGTIYDDDELPAVSLSGPAGLQNGPFAVSIDFTKTVGGFEASDLTVGNGTASLSGSGASYTASITPSASGTVTVDVAAGVAQDGAGNPNSASAQYSVEADLDRPSVTLSGPADPQGGPFAVAIDFSEPVAGFEASDLTVSNGSASLSGSGSSYTAMITPSASGQVTVDVASAAAHDAAGNDNTAAAQYSVAADLVAPTVSLSGPSGPEPGAFTVSIDFSEGVAGFEASDVTVGNGSASDFSGTGSSYSATITPSASGTVTVDVAAGAAHDAAGSDNSAAVQYAVEADLAAPSVTLSGPSDTQGGPFTVSIDFSEGVAGFEASDLTVSNGAASDFSGTGSSYSATITPSSSGQVTVDVAAGAAHDAAGNDNTAAAQYAVEADLVSPSVSLSGPADTQGGPFTVSIDFSEGVAGFEASDVSVGNGSAVLSGSGSSYSAVITPSSSGQVTVDVAAGVAHDAAGNDNTAAAQYAVGADLVAPSVTLSGPAGPVAGDFTVSIVFSEPVSGFESSEVTVSNGTARLSGSGSSYSATITPSSSGTVTVDVAAGVAVDAHGHLNSAAVRYAVEADLAAPSVSLSGPADVQGGPFTVSITFSEEVAGFEESEVTVSNGTAVLSGSGSSYSATITPSSTGQVTVDVAAAVAHDAAGNDNTAAARYAVAADLVAPSVSLSGPADVQGGPFTVSITFSEEVAGFEESEVSVSNGTAVLSGSGSSYSATITPSASGTVTVDVAAGVAVDVHGHLNSAAARYSVEADLVAPSVTLSGPSGPVAGAFTVSITFSEPVSGFEESEVTVGNGTAVLSGADSSYSATITPSSDGTVTVDVAAGVARDAAGNGNSAAAQYAVATDLAAPSVTLSGPAGPVTGAFTVSITFSESVSGFEESEVAVGNGSATLSGSGSSYSAVVTPSSSGTVTVDVAAGVAVDLHGHLNNAAAQYSVEADLVAPSVTLSGPADTQGGPFTVSIVFSEPVAGFEASEVTVGNGTAVLSGSGSSYSAVVTPSSSGTVTVDVAAGVAHDAAGNNNSSAAQYSVAADLVAPSVTLSGPSGPVTGAFTVSITFSEPVSGFESSEVTVGNGTAVLSGSGSSYSAAITPSASGTVTVDVAAGVAVDVHGHLNSAAVRYAVEANLNQARENRAPQFAASTAAHEVPPLDADFARALGAGGTQPGGAPSGGVRRSVAENSPPGTAIGAPVAASDADGDALTYSLSGADAASFALDAGSGQLRTQAALDYETRTTYAVNVAVSDGNGGSAALAVAIDVTDVDEAPAAAADAATVAEGGAVTLDVLANDTDPEGAALRVELVETAAHGAATIDAAGLVTYTHDGGETTADGFSYRVHDGSAYSAAAAVTVTVTPVNDAPAADAGADQEAAEGETVYLNGSGTDPEGEALSFAWTQESGEAVALSAAASAAAQFTAPVQLAADAVLVFSLVVTDASGAVSAPDEVTVTVAPGTNDAPVADAGPDREAAEGETVYLSGSGTDPEGEALSFAWTQVSGASVELGGAASDSLGFTAPAMLSEDAVLVFSLVVTDARGLASAPDEVTVTVKAAPNDAPVFAAPDYTFGLVEHVDAGADPLTVGDVLARDPEDEGVAYALAAGDSSRFAVDAASGRITYTGPGEDARNTGSYVLAVSAADPRGASSTVTVTILVGVARVAKKSVLSAEQMEIRRTQRAEVMELSLAALGRTLAASTVDVVGRRVESSAAAEGSYAELAGRRLSGAPGGRAPAALSLEAAMAGQEGFSEGEAVSDQEMLTGSSFQWALERPGRGVWTLWGRGVFNGFAGQPRGRDFTMHDGQLSQGYMGLDYRRGGGALAGVALSHGASELYYESGSVGRGDVLARLLSVYPYARWAPRPGLDLWGLVGLGRGEARLVYDGRTDLSSDLGLRLAAVGARNLLLTYRGVGVAARADAFAVRLQPEESEELARVRADARRLRLLLEGTVNWTLTPQSRLTPSLEVGGRWDGGDAERGLGAEVGGGLHYAHQDNGLDVEVRGRRLLAHGESAFRDWGASVVLRLAPGDRRGLGLELEPAWGRGARQQSAQDLWRDEQAAPEYGGDRSASRRPERTDLRLSYGLAHPAGTLTPFGEWALDREAGSLRLGARLEGGESESPGAGRRWLEIFAERRAHAGAAPERRVGVQGNLTY